ncbi:MAG: nucleotide exchange factor GrpE [Propionibacteriaceae bacterium]|nr:nucleotide exchange factor GrpE [Propionibacteriaceae bacterium]
MNDRARAKDQDGEEEPHGPTVRDKRRIDPDTYQVREPRTSAAPTPEVEVAEETEPMREAEETGTQAAEVAELKAALAERTGDLQRLQAEYINYKRRVDRDRDVSRRASIESVLKDFLPVLDDLRSAREHEELSGGFKAVAEEVERVAGKYGLETFGQAGDAFDPHIHEALLHAHATGITGPTCVEILQAGYRIGDKILRPARVAVAEPGPDEVLEAESELPLAEAAGDQTPPEATPADGANQQHEQ